MPQAKRLSDKEKIEIQRLILEGLGDVEIARKIGRSRQVVAKNRASNQVKTTTTAGKTVHARLTAEEYEAFSTLVEAQGRTVSSAIRNLMRLAVGAFEPHTAEIEALASSRKELIAVGRNLNSMTKLANSGRLKWNARDGAVVQRLEERVATLSDDLTQLINVARRKTMADVPFSDGSDQ